MAAHWEDCLLSDVVRFGNGKAIKPGGTGLYPVFGSNGIIGGSDEFLHENGVVIGRVGAYCGAVVYCPNKFWASDNTLVAYPLSEQVDTQFLYHLLANANLSRYAGGAAQPLVTQTVLKQVEVRIPELDIQLRIAGILSAYDELIENSQQRINTLELMARALYQEWFIHFRFPGHESIQLIPSSHGDIPEGWEVRKITDFADFTRGFEPGSNAYKSEPDNGLVKFLRVGDLGKRDSDIYVEEQLVQGRILKPTDIAISLDGSVGVVRIGMNGAYSSGIRRIDIKDPSRLGWVFAYQLLLSDRSQETIHAHAKGTTIKHAGSAVAALEFISPSATLIAKFEGIATPIVEQVLILQEQVKNLRATRDLILPRLLSGQIEVEAIAS
jgi:type I restriction enzyme S subunit